MLQAFYLPPLLVVFAPAFLLGILHTAIPCEDKAIFFFWSFGISKTPTRSLFILILYGFGLIFSNMIIAVGTILISFIPQILLPGIIPDQHIINFFGSIGSMGGGIILLFYIIRRGYFPHSKHKDEISQLNWEKKRTPYLFGVLAGFAPCIFEVIVYSWCLQYSLSGGLGFVDGIFTVFYFSLGTFVGLFPLALAKQGTAQIIKSRDTKKKWIFIFMIIIILIFNGVVLIFSILRIPVFPAFR